MDAIEYIKKAQKICAIYTPSKGSCRTCEQCPLEKFDCGFPDDEEKVALTVKIVEKFDVEKPGAPNVCPNCGRKLPVVAALEFCPYCGTEVETRSKKP